MTAFNLFLWIMLVIAVQAAIAMAVGWMRQQARYRQLGQAVPANEEGHASANREVTAGWRGTRRFQVVERVVESRDAAVCSFHLRPEDGQPLSDYLPGQFLTFELAMPDGSRLVRCYSLSDAPHTDHYRISVKRVPAPAGQPDLPPGRSSSYFHDHVTVGMFLDVRAPSGHFHLTPGEAPIVLIAGGIGITPLLAMLEWSLAHQPEREVWLFYGVRNGREVAMAERLKAQASRYGAFRLRLCFSDPDTQEVAGVDFHHAGRISADLLRLQLPIKPYHFYICGPGPMMNSLVQGLAEWGIPEGQIHFEAFGPASVKRARLPVAGDGAIAPSSSDIVVTFARSGLQVPWRREAGSLLELAEQAGVNVDSGCRGGACGSCRTTISSGEVSYHQPPEYDPEPGMCLLCITSPKTHLTLEA